MWTWCTDERGALSLSDWRVFSRSVLVLAGAVLMVLFNADRYEGTEGGNLYTLVGLKYRSENGCPSAKLHQLRY